ncbi:protein unc-93 homolog A-like isoform X4 [Stegodyphus dumicola]|uniref:protein unc-93 homolog A-like isoform X4 n=1 Tax=Stegodyphus dumicola TaxID=202533 RepID=UPI0015AFF1EC|nr:protein unc-93 homolog A-like isoform X4 [Stegodyphus dumicola]
MAHKIKEDYVSDEEGLIVNPSINQESPCLEPAVLPSVNMSKKRIIKNFLVMNFTFFLSLTGFFILANLQSTMNAAKGMGPDSQLVVYGFSMLSCIVLPDILIAKFGAKKTYVLAMLVSVPYIASNFILRWDTMLSAAALLGLTSGPMNAAQSVYTDEMAVRFKHTVKEKLETVRAFFFGIFVFFSENIQVWGNAISYFVLSLDKHVPPSKNFSLLTHCGIKFRSNETNTNLIPPSDHERFLLISIFSVMGIVAVILGAFFMDPLENDIREEDGCQEVKNRVLAAVKLLKNPYQLLLLPISIFCGLENGFYVNDFTQAYIACSWGIHHVGFVTICFGVCGAIMAVLVGPLVRCISQMSVLILAACINVTTCGLLYVWEPTPDNVTTYFVFAGVWGMADAIWWSQITALYGLMFPNDREAAFSNFFFWSFLGFFLCYSYANYFSVALKLGILLFFLVTGIICYLIGQIKIKRSPRREYIVIEDE